MTRVRLSVPERREELLGAAVEVIEQRGVAALRVADVARALGVSSALVIYHFETKEKLVAAAFAHAAAADLARLGELLDVPGSAQDRLREAVRWYSPTGLAKGWRLWIEGWAVALREPTLREVSEHLDRQWQAALTRVICEGVAAGEFDCPDPGPAAERLTALLDGLAVRMTVHPNLLAREAMESWIEQALVRELRFGEPTQ